MARQIPARDLAVGDRVVETRGVKNDAGNLTGEWRDVLFRVVHISHGRFTNYTLENGEQRQLAPYVEVTIDG